MSTQRISMHTIKEVLRLTAAGLSQRQIAHSLDLSNGVVAKYQAAAQRASLSWPLPAELDDEALAQRLSSKTVAPADDQSNSRRPPPDFVYIHEQLKHKCVTRQLLWEEYRAEQPAGYSYTQFCFHYQEWKSRLKLVMRQTHRAGEKLFVDYCGPTVPVVNALTGEVREAQIFVAVLGASNYTYAEATWTQGLPDWLSSHTRAFAFFNGVPALIIPDNLLSAVTKACRYEPLLNASYNEMLAHYSTAALPAHPYEYQDWRRGRMVSIDYHVEVEKHFYSVPHSLCRQKVDARLTEKMVEFFHAGKRVAVHVRSRRPGSYSTNPEHMPKAHRAHLEWTPGRFLNWGVQVGPHTRDLVKHLLENRPHPEMGYRSCLGLLNLAKRFGSTRLEAACQRAMVLGSPTRRSVVSLLEQGLDQQPLPETADAQPSLLHENIRGPEYYQ